MSENDVECILNTLIYDGLVNLSTIDGEKMYSLDTTGLQFNGLMVPPCGMTNTVVFSDFEGICPVAHLCGKTREIQPKTCKYLKQWLEF